MTISELICRLQSIKCEHGDLLVHIPNRNPEGWLKDVDNVEQMNFYEDEKHKNLKRCVIS